ncbi:PrsW family intramembrane metalloprotease [Candidatus Gracilibacteria bacterium]|nr:PrsW family intramembrane metalloprotease [Candidatus Gracilibacteria bacterium]
MISHIIFIFFAFLTALLPIYLWGYGVSYLLDTPWNRQRFISGMIIGGLSVGLVWLFSFIAINSVYILFSLGIFASVLSIVIWAIIRGGSIYARKLLQQFANSNMMSIIALSIATVMLVRYIPGGTHLLVPIVPLLLSSIIEESSKHLMSIGLMSQDFAFSRRDIIIFTLFVVLGFVFAENLLYLFRSDLDLSTWIFRSFFSLTAHLLSASICAYVWWRALSYEPYSIRYIAIFSIGFALAVITHLGYNLILREGSMIGLFIYMIVGYVVVTRGLSLERTTV